MPAADFEKSIPCDTESLPYRDLRVATHEFRHIIVYVHECVDALVRLDDDAPHFAGFRAEYLSACALRKTEQSLRRHDDADVETRVQPLVYASTDEKSDDEEHDRHEHQ